VLDTVDLIRALTDALAESGAEPEGDDSVLIARLEAVLHPEAAAPIEPEPEIEPQAAPVPAPARAARSLIDRLGGDATLDAASEMIAPRLLTDAAFADLFAGQDPDVLQAAVRTGLIDLARKPDAGGAFAAGLAAASASPPSQPAVASAFDLAAEALRELEIEEPAIAELRGRLAAAPPVPKRIKLSPPQPPAPAPVAAASTAAEPAQAAEAPPAGRGGDGQPQTIRVSLDALEHLMTVVSELVLIRNQLIQILRLETESPFAAPLNRLNQVTSELQEGVMTTRMQPISGAWAKLPRLVRDLAQDLDKKIDLVMLGQETELDRQVLELIKDPLTHMIRNAADHGLETRSERIAAGKSESGRITLQARHEGGAIIIEVADDGRGLSAEKIKAKALGSGLITPADAERMSDADLRQIIFMAGFSTAAQVTAVSGRGVGMDVVRTNVEKIGGTIEVTSVEGVGSRFTIRIPLTLTIVSSLIVECCGERFAIPQSSVVELVSSSGGSGRTIEYLDNAAVLRLRDRLLPLVALQALLGLEAAAEPSGEACIVVARVGSFTFGLIVDRVFDTEEIVVKPVATVLRHLKLYSGATILGDGSVVLILDPKGISMEAGAGQGATGAQDFMEQEEGAGLNHDRQAILVFRASDDTLKAAPLAAVSRIEEIGADQVERVDDRTVAQYRGRLMPIVGVDGEPARHWDGDARRPLLVFARDGDTVGLLVDEIIDIVEGSIIPELGSRSEGVVGSLIIAGTATELLDVDSYLRRATAAGGRRGAPPAQPVNPARNEPAPAAGEPRRLLLVDPSPFSQLLLRPLLSRAGYDVTVAADPQAALALYEGGEQFHLIMADTSPGAPNVQEFAATFAQTTRWHQVPLLGLALHAQGGNAAAPPGFDGSTLLDAVSAAIQGLKGAA
jgi:two-component system chemotaxis sensor kinase CheA